MKKPTYKEPDVDLSFRSTPLTKADEIEISKFIANYKKKTQKAQKEQKVN